MPEDGVPLASMVKVLVRTMVRDEPRAMSRPSLLFRNTLRSRTLWLLLPAAPPLGEPSSPVIRMPAAPRLPTRRMAWMKLSWLRSDMMPMQKLRTSKPVISTSRESTTCRPALRSDRVLGPNWPAVSPGHALGMPGPSRTVRSSHAEPSTATVGVPLPFHGPSIRAGPTMAGSWEPGLITSSPPAGGVSTILNLPGSALLLRMAQRSVPSLPSSPGRWTFSAVPFSGLPSSTLLPQAASRMAAATQARKRVRMLLSSRVGAMLERKRPPAMRRRPT